MKKLLSVLTVLLMLVSVATAEAILPANAVTIALQANETTGYSWTGFILGGDSVVLTSAEGTYIADPAPDGMCGAGGQTYFTLIPVRPGSSIIGFTYARPWENDTADRLIVLADVDEELNLYLSDVTNGGMIQGTVLSVDPDDHSAHLLTEAHGEIIARFDAGTELPVVNEQIVIYTNGTMTMSLPAIVNVLAWGSVPSDAARTEAK